MMKKLPFVLPGIFGRPRSLLPSLALGSLVIVLGSSAYADENSRPAGRTESNAGYPMGDDSRIFGVLHECRFCSC